MCCVAVVPSARTPVSRHVSRFPPCPLPVVHAHTLTLNGYRHTCYRSLAPASSSPSVVALHGFGLDGYRTFRSVAHPLRQQGVTLYALDLLGFGASEAPERTYSLHHYAELLAAFSTRLDGPAPILLGHSMGGKIAAATAVLRPEAFAGVLLVNPGGFSWMAPWIPVLASTRATDALLRRPWMRRYVLARLPLGRLLARPKQARQALRLRRSHYALDLDATGLRERLRTIARPVGVLWGHGDAYLPAGTLDRLRDHLPQALVYRLPQAGHFPMWTAPDAFADVVVQFMQRIG